MRCVPAKGLHTVRLAACLGLLLAAAMPAPRALASWASENCDGGAWARDTWKRSQADDYAMQAVGEGYEFGGGCYRLNGYDDTPNTATDGGGEGADCSGFTFKTWAMKNNIGGDGFTFWTHQRNIHGPYSTWAYFDPAAGYPFRLISKAYSATMFMDALVERHSSWGHIALIHQEGSSGSDYIVHARNNTMGTELRYLPYRSDADFKAVARKGWTAECYPRCG
jgi:hypothetical protein